MRTVTRVERIGERLADVDWNYDFRSHFDTTAMNPDAREARCAEYVERLREIERRFKAGERFSATTYGGLPRIWGPVLDVGMYDGWPYWRPVPSVHIGTWMGGEWHAFDRVHEIACTADTTGAGQ